MNMSGGEREPFLQAADSEADQVDPEQAQAWNKAAQQRVRSIEEGPFEERPVEAVACDTQEVGLGAQRQDAPADAPVASSVSIADEAGNAEWNSSMATWEASCQFPFTKDAEEFYPWLLPAAIVINILAIVGCITITYLIFHYILPYFDSVVFYLLLPFVILGFLLSPVQYIYHYFRLRGTAQVPPSPEPGVLRRRALTHAVVVCCYKEPIQVLHRTFASIAAQKGVEKRPIVVLASEARDPTRHSQAAILKEAYGASYARFLLTEHALKEGEVAGKSSNENFALRQLRRVLDADGFDPFEVMVTIVDADSLMSPTYLAHVEDSFYSMPDGRRIIYNGPLNTYRNLVEAGLVIQMHEICRCHTDTFYNPLARSFPLSNYSLTLGFCAELDYWTPDNIPEDVHTTIKAVLLSYGGCVVLPVPSIISNDLVPDVGDRYIQAKRHHWGMTETAYVFAVFKHMNMSFEVFLAFLLGELGRPGSFTASCVCFTGGINRLIVLWWLYMEWDNITNEAKTFMLLLLVQIPLGWIQFWIAEICFWRSSLMRQFDIQHPSTGRWIALMVLSPILVSIGELLFYVIPILHILLHIAFVGQLNYVTAPKGSREAAANAERVRRDAL